jgi:glucose/arabinose dehydrogenase
MKMNKLALNSLMAVGMIAASSSVFADRASAEKNLHKLNVPEGFNVEVYAEVPNARQMAFGQSTGTVFVGTRGENVYAVVDKDKDRRADDVVTILDDLKVGNGVAMHQGNLYVAEQHRITMYSAPGFDLNLPFKQMREVVYDNLPDKAHHGWRYISFGPDNKLYVAVGAPCNICEVSGYEGSIMRMNPDGSDAEIYAKGVRNSVGMDFQPQTGALYFTDNNTDMMGDDDPAGELNFAPKADLHFGFPFYAGGHSQHPDWKDKKAPKDVKFPVAEFQAHTANLGFKFYTGSQFPADYKGDAIIAQHGSWNRTSPVGYQLMRVTFDDKHQVSGQEVFIDGWLNDGEAWGRPTDVLQLPDGSLLVSDDYNGVIYRISYGSENTVAVTNSSTKTLSGFALPESAVATVDGRVFITEIGEFGKAGDGKVIIVNKDGTRDVLTEGLTDPKGMDLWNGAFYIADVDKVIKVDMAGKVTTVADTQDFPTKPVFLNDIEIDGLGNIYVSDSGDDKGDNAGIYKITPDKIVTEVLPSHTAVSRPNGLLLDGLNQLLVVDFDKGGLYQVNTNTASVTPLNQNFGAGDGIVRDTFGFLYISDWKNGKVWQLMEPKATPQLIAEGMKSSADITVSSDGKFLIVPDMMAGEIKYIAIH